MMISLCLLTMTRRPDCAPLTAMSTISSILLQFVTIRPEKLKTRIDFAVRATRHGAATMVSLEDAGLLTSGSTTQP